MLNMAVRNTAKLIREKSKSENVRLGRLFTKKDTARLMAGMVSLDKTKSAYTILDPAAGTGILSAAMIEHICKSAPSAKQIFLTCYETEEAFLPMLEDNLERIRKKCRHDYDVRLFVTIYSENYLTGVKNHYTITFFDTVEDKFDLIIVNPPSYMINKGSEEANAAGCVTMKAVSSEYLFAKVAAEHLEPDGQLVTLLPTTFATAASLSLIRKTVLDILTVKKVHLFVGNGKNLSRAIPLKKNIIIAFSAKTDEGAVEISTSTDNGTAAKTVKLSPLPYDFIVDKTDGSLTLPKSVEDTKIVSYINSFPETLESLGLKMRTGLVIDSKCKKILFDEAVPGTIPLIRLNAIKNSGVSFPAPGVKKQYLMPVSPALFQKNKNLIIIKRVPAKSDVRFLNAAIYFAAQRPSDAYISTHNKVNFIDTKDSGEEICARLACGLFALLNSTIYDRYLSIISKSKQINSKEMKSLPLPPRNLIENIGARLMAAKQYTVPACDAIVNPTLRIVEKR